MTRQISEADWRVFRQLRAIALERFYGRVLSEIDGLVSDTGKSARERYQAVFELIQLRDSELADAFDDPRRSTAVLQLARIQSHELLIQEELARFSPETLAAVELLKECWGD